MMIHGFSFFWRRGVGGWAPTPFIPHKTCAKKGATRQGPGTSQGAAGSRGEGTHGPVGARAARTPPATRERSRPSTNTSSRRRGVESAAVSRLDLPPRPSASRAPANHRGAHSPAVSDAAAVAHTLNTPDDDEPRVFFFLGGGEPEFGRRLRSSHTRHVRKKVRRGRGPAPPRERRGAAGRGRMAQSARGLHERLRRQGSAPVHPQTHPLAGGVLRVPPSAGLTYRRVRRLLGLRRTIVERTLRRCPTLRRTP